MQKTEHSHSPAPLHSKYTYSPSRRKPVPPAACTTPGSDHTTPLLSTAHPAPATPCSPKRSGTTPGSMDAAQDRKDETSSSPCQPQNDQPPVTPFSHHIATHTPTPHSSCRQRRSSYTKQPLSPHSHTVPRIRPWAKYAHTP